jgi:beta-glucosidase
VEYREGIYTGYRYYETIADDMNATNAGSGDTWYDQNVVYPFGYGLSYTTFDWELAEDIAPTATISAANETVTMKVKVTNTGDYAGKDVVQIYYSAPYTKGGIEKASVNLIEYAKTDLLQPGESQTVTIQFVAQDMASFDWNDANNNGFKGYELEKGDYTISARRNSHEEVLSMTRMIGADIQCKTDYTTGSEITPVFTGDYTTVNDSLLSGMISRADGLTQPAAATVEDRTLTDEEYERLSDQITYRSYQDDIDDPWYVADDGLPNSWTQATAYTGNETQITAMNGIEYTEPTIDEDGKLVIATDDGTKAWDEFMNQLTWEDMCNLVSKSGVAGIDEIGVSDERYADGPIQFSGGTLWACAPITAATYNTELAEEQGRLFGNEGLLRNKHYWAGPAMNLHRSPLSGRNVEYYSEDGVQAAKIAAACVKGASDMGIVTYIKHMFLNDQESYRDIGGGVLTFATEQVCRELYLKPFEAALKQGGSLGIMSSFNRLGYVQDSQNYPLHQLLVRNEWKSDAVFMTDAWMGNYCPIDLLVRAGDSQALASDTSSNPNVALEVGEWDATANCVRVKADAEGTTTMLSPTHYAAVRKAAQRILYIYANSAANKNCYGSVYAEKGYVAFDLNCNQTKSVTIQGLDVSAVTVSDADQAALAEYGLSISSDGIISGTATKLGKVEIALLATVDGYLTVSVPLEIEVISSIHDSGTDLSGTIKAGEQINVTFTGDYYTYGGYLTVYDEVSGTNMSGNVFNYYTFEEGYAAPSYESKGNVVYISFSDVEAPDAYWIHAENIKDATGSYEYSYTVTVTNEAGETVNTFTVTKQTATHTGAQGVEGYEVETGVVLSGAFETAGTYTITITLHVPMVPGFGYRFPNNIHVAARGGSYATITRTITVVVEA